MSIIPRLKKNTLYEESGAGHNFYPKLHIRNLSLSNIRLINIGRCRCVRTYNLRILKNTLLVKPYICIYAAKLQLSYKTTKCFIVFFNQLQTERRKSM